MTKNGIVLWVLDQKAYRVKRMACSIARSMLLAVVTINYCTAKDASHIDDCSVLTAVARQTD